ncbi:hypothetical protein QFZ31_000472 [Neobacillus niacini]|nr:hypothetical protein [Neobacillus niacini]
MYFYLLEISTTIKVHKAIKNIYNQDVKDYCATG